MIPSRSDRGSRLVRPAVVGLVLLGATAASFAVGHQHVTDTSAVVGILGLAAFKIWLVGFEFMELRLAPTPLRTAFATYCVVIWLTLSGVYVCV